jgi:hypothetical protein
MTLRCPRCGNIVPEKAGFCAYCGTPLKLLEAIEVKKSGYPIAGGILEIISACICLFVGIVSIVALEAVFNYRLHYGLWFIGTFGFVGFAFALLGGIFALRRAYPEMVLTGASLTMLSGLVIVLALVTHPPRGLAFALLGTTIIILSTITLIFIAVSKAEFT